MNVQCFCWGRYRTMHILKLFTDLRQVRGAVVADEWLRSGQLEDLQAVDCSQITALTGSNSTATKLCHSYDSKFNPSTSHPNPRVLTALQVKTAIPQCLQLEWVRYANLIGFGQSQDHAKGNQVCGLQCYRSLTVVSCFYLSFARAFRYSSASSKSKIGVCVCFPHRSKSCKRL